MLEHVGYVGRDGIDVRSHGVRPGMRREISDRNAGQDKRCGVGGDELYGCSEGRVSDDNVSAIPRRYVAICSIKVESYALVTVLENLREGFFCHLCEGAVYGYVVCRIFNVKPTVVESDEICRLVNFKVGD
jgi:hypothetical protein